MTDDYGVWIERVIGSSKRAESGPATGYYPYWRKKLKRDGVTVVADIYPDFGTTGPDQPHLWGVVFPTQARLTKFDPKTNGVIEIRPYASEKKVGRKERTLDDAKNAADECMRVGRNWDGLARNANGTLKALDRQPEAADDVPDEAFT